MRWNDEMKTGAMIWYYDEEGSGWPGEVLAIKRWIKVCINHIDGDKTIWVKPSKLELQAP